jgi:CheY-like chemotaxis protein
VAAPQAELHAGDPALPGGHALVIDDDDLFRAFVRTIFERAGWMVCEASAGEEAIELILGVRFDLVISDYQLGAMTGVDVLAAVRRRDVVQPFILMSGRLPDDQRRHALRFDAFVLDKSTLLENLEALLAAMI